jgi:acetyltransferase
MSTAPALRPTRVRAISGREFLLRPIVPDDAPRLIEAFLRCDPEDRRLRFFSSIRELSEGQAARLAHIDPDHEMVLVAIEPAVDPEAIVGVVHLVNDAIGGAAEIGIIVRSDLKRMGLGHLLMQAILDYAAARGIPQVSGHVLAENRTMLQMARELGATITRDGDDFTVMRVLFDLVPREPR